MLYSDNFNEYIYFIFHLNPASEISLIYELFCIISKQLLSSIASFVCLIVLKK